MTPDQIQSHFTRPDGSYFCARWGRPIVPVVFGVDDATLAIFKGGIEALATVAGHPILETDPELGANLMIFFLRDWAELLDVPDFDQLIPNLAPLCEKLIAQNATHYRAFRFDEAGAIKAVFSFIRVDAAIEAVPAEDLALLQATQAMLTWGEAAFATQSPLVEHEGRVILRPEIAALIHGAYQRVMPAVAQDPSHALRLSARLPQALNGQI